MLNQNSFSHGNEYESDQPFLSLHRFWGYIMWRGKKKCCLLEDIWIFCILRNYFLSSAIWRKAFEWQIGNNSRNGLLSNDNCFRFFLLWGLVWFQIFCTAGVHRVMIIYSTHLKQTNKKNQAVSITLSCFLWPYPVDQNGTIGHSCLVLTLHPGTPDPGDPLQVFLPGYLSSLLLTPMDTPATLPYLCFKPLLTCVSCIVLSFSILQALLGGGGGNEKLQNLTISTFIIATYAFDRKLSY